MATTKLEVYYLHFIMAMHWNRFIFAYMIKKPIKHEINYVLMFLTSRLIEAFLYINRYL